VEKGIKAAFGNVEFMAPNANYEHLSGQAFG
jgi:hypothetical protein